VHTLLIAEKEVLTESVRVLFAADLVSSLLIPAPLLDTTVVPMLVKGFVCSESMPWILLVNAARSKRMEYQCTAFLKIKGKMLTETLSALFCVDLASSLILTPTSPVKPKLELLAAKLFVS